VIVHENDTSPLQIDFLQDPRKPKFYCAQAVGENAAYVEGLSTEGM
jgi:hypothetical protein